MQSPFLLGLIGFAIVVGSLLGGFALGGLLHSWITPKYDFFYVVWLWVGGLPFWWLCTRYADTRQFGHPMLVYVALLPCVMLMGAINRQFEPGTPWGWIVFAALTTLVACVNHGIIALKETSESQTLSSPNSTPE